MRCGIYVRVSTDEQRDNGYSIDSQLRKIKEYCEKNNYDIVDVYNDAGHSGKDLMRPEMQRLLKDIKSHKIENEEKVYLRQGKWNSDKVYKILINSIYIGTLAYGKTKRKAQDVLYIDNYCEPIIDKNTWYITRKRLEKNKHPNYGEHIHLFTGIVKCPTYGKIMSSTNSFKNSGKPNQKVYYHVTCNNPNCKSKGFHYNCDKIEEKLIRVLNELTRYMYGMDNEIIVCNSTKTKDIKDIEKVIEKLKMQEKKLVDLYLSSTLNVETINNKNDIIKREIENLNKKKQQIDPNNDYKEYTIELLKKLDCDIENDEAIFKNRLGFAFVFDSLNRKSKKELIKRLIDTIEIKR